MSAAALRHSLFLYGSDDEYAARIVPFLAEGVDEGDAVCLVVTARHRMLLEDGLGAVSARMTFIDPVLHYTRVESALASYDHQLRRMSAAGPREIRIFAELPFDLRQPGPWDRWMAYEAILTRAFEQYPLRLVCGYDKRTTPATRIADLERAHPEVVTDAARPSDSYADAAEVVRALSPAPRAVPELPLLAAGGQPSALRRRLADEMARAGVPAAAAQDGLVAVDELLANARRHAGGVGELRAGRVGERFVIELCDQGPGHDDPLAGYLPPRRGGLAGAGLWVARQLSADLELLSSPGGLVARLWI
jgi:anti-sigma regulatory factor (Ser/Thr protein kinase)